MMNLQESLSPQSCDGVDNNRSNCSGSPSSSSSSEIKHIDLIKNRKQRKFIAESKKDDTYWDRRRRNNEAAKRSRDKRRYNDMVLEQLVVELTKENHVLKAQLDAIKDRFNISGETLVSVDKIMATLPTTHQVLNVTRRAELTNAAPSVIHQTADFVDNEISASLHKQNKHLKLQSREKSCISFNTNTVSISSSPILSQNQQVLHHSSLTPQTKAQLLQQQVFPHIMMAPASQNQKQFSIGHNRVASVSGNDLDKIRNGAKTELSNHKNNNTPIQLLQPLTTLNPQYQQQPHKYQQHQHLKHQQYTNDNVQISVESSFNHLHFQQQQQMPFVPYLDTTQHHDHSFKDKCHTILDASIVNGQQTSSSSNINGKHSPNAVALTALAVAAAAATPNISSPNVSNNSPTNAILSLPLPNTTSLLPVYNEPDRNVLNLSRHASSPREMQSDFRLRAGSDVSNDDEQDIGDVQVPTDLHNSLTLKFRHKSHLGVKDAATTVLLALQNIKQKPK